jgi:hypothetical protein
MLKPVQKLLLAMCFCLLDGMVIGSGCIALDYGEAKFATVMLLGSAVSTVLVIAYIITVFKSIWVESRLEHDLEQMINLSHFD